MAKRYISANTLFLAGNGVIIGATSATLTTLTDIYSNTLTMSDFGDLGYITFEPDTSTEEQATFTGITANPNGTYTLTGLKTSLAKSPYTQTSGLVRSHSGGTKIVISDTAAFWDTFANKNNDEVITGTWTFNNFPVTPTNPVASTTTKGITKISVTPVDTANPIAVGDNDPRVPSSTFLPALIGMISPYAGSTSPTGWLLCDGSAVSRTTYASLFSICSTNYGVGDNSTTFNLPNLKNRIPIGLDTSAKIVIDNCDSAWTAGSNVTATNDTSDKKEGTGSVKLDIGSSTTAGQILGYKAISSLSLAGKTTVGMWIKSSINLSNGDLKYQMDDTAALASPLESINIPVLVAGVWTKIYLTLANPSNDTAIISQGIYQTNDVGAFTLWIDDINEGENYELGATGGEKTHQITVAELASHNHTLQYITSSSSGSFPQSYGDVIGNGINNTGWADSTKTRITSAGSDIAHNNLQPYITINYIIKY